MKAYTYILLLSALPLLLGSCSKDTPENPDEEKIAVTEIETSLGSRDGSSAMENQTKATLSDYAVNTSFDPTFSTSTNGSLTARGGNGWKLDVQILKSGVTYTPGHGIFSLNGTNWVVDASSPNNPPFFPNYSRQNVNATLYPTGWTPGAAIATNQAATDGSGLLAQDILVQNPGAVLPAHKPKITLRHANSMVDVMLTNVTRAQIQGVVVIANSITYTPYEITTRPGYIEFLAIIPTGVTNPQIQVTTQQGAVYTETLTLTRPTQINTCYCAKLTGLELMLSSVTVIDWAIGKAIEGEYSAITSYPAFRGTPGLSIIVTYFNGLTQPLTFNAQGEDVAKPLGRRITGIQIVSTGQQIPINPALVLNSMVIDLNPYLP